MALYLFLAFLLVPLAEIGLFIEIGERIGLWSTLGVIVLTALVGTAIVRAQGLQTLGRARASLERNEVPLAEVFDGLCLLIAGLLLLTPGFLTDSLGAALCIPPLRAWLRLAVGRWILAHGHVHIRTADGDVRVSRGRRRRDEDDVIEGDYEEVPERPERDLPPPEESHRGRGRR